MIYDSGDANRVCRTIRRLRFTRRQADEDEKDTEGVLLFGAAEMLPEGRLYTVKGRGIPAKEGDMEIMLLTGRQGGNGPVMLIYALPGVALLKTGNSPAMFLTVNEGPSDLT